MEKTSIRNQVFISYSHRDRKWLNELRTHLTPLVREQALAVWDDTQLRAGDRWLDTIEQALDSAKVAVLLVSANYLASDFIASREMPPILAAQARQGLRIIWIPVSASAYAVTPIKDFQAGCDPARPLDSLGVSRRKQIWVEIAETIASSLDPAGTAMPEPDDGPVENRVVLLYKRGAEPDESLLHYLETELYRRQHPVWIDRHLRVGMDWAKAISAHLEKAAAVIPLLSESSVQSEMLTYEVQVAHLASQRQEGRPKILPVRVRLSGALAPPLDILNPIQHAAWDGERDNLRLVTELSKAIAEPSTALPRYVPPVGGALSLNDRFYIVRPTDSELQAAIARKESIVLVKGARQMGKTSLLARGLKAARDAGLATLYTDFQKLNLRQLSSLDEFYKSLCEWLAEEMDLEVDMDEIWRTKRSPNGNFERFLERHILEHLDRHLVWAMDETDRLFEYDFKDEFFGLVRSWHNERQFASESGWSNLTILIAYATEPHLFISNLSQSPFNIGLNLELADFTIEQVECLNKMHESPLRSPLEVAEFHGLVGGQPYLVRRGLFEMANKRQNFAQFQSIAGRDDGPYGDHLRRILVVLARNPALCAALSDFLRDHTVLSASDFFRLRRAGLVAGNSDGEAKARCRLYSDYLQRHIVEVQGAKAV